MSHVAEIVELTAIRSFATSKRSEHETFIFQRNFIFTDGVPFLFSTASGSNGLQPLEPSAPHAGRLSYGRPPAEALALKQQFNYYQFYRLARMSLIAICIRTQALLVSHHNPAVCRKHGQHNFVCYDL